MSKTQLTPEIRFAEFSSKWKLTQLNKVMYESKERNTALKYNKNDVLSVSGELGIINQIEHLGRSFAGASVANYHVVNVGEIVYTKSPLKKNPYGIIKLNKYKPGIVSTLYAVYKVRHDELSGEWLEHYFSLDENTNRYLRPLVKKGAKNDMKINNLHFLSDSIYIPNIKEQNKIASFLTEVDKKIQAQKKKKELLERYKKAMLQKIFTQELRFKDVKGKRYPNWISDKLGNRCSFFSGGTPLTTKREYYGGNIPFIRSGEISSDHTELYLTKAGLENSAAKLINKGDLIYALYGANSGDVAISKNAGAINQAILCIRSEINKYFLLSFLEHQKSKILSSYLQGGQGNLSAEIIKTLLIKIPCMEEQEDISNLFENMDKKIDTMKNQIILLNNWKNCLIQKMFV